jgi:hypothetical protein
MTDYSNKLKHDSASNMQALKTAIVKGEQEHIKMLLTNLVFDELQKAYLINVAEKMGDLNIIALLNDAPATP